MNSKTTFLLTIGLLFSYSFAFGQEEVELTDYYYHQKGSHTLNLGVGYPTAANIAATFVSSITNAEAKATPQFTFKHEYGLTDRLGIGVQAGYYTAETESIDFGSIGTNLIAQACCLLNPGDECCDDVTTGSMGTSTYKISALSVGGRGVLHFKRIEKLDTYSVISLAYTFLNTKENGDKNPDFLGSNAPSFEYFAGVGARYYFNPNFAAYGEFGSGALTPFHVNLGLTYRP